MQMKDKTALVTGGGRGIGLEITRQLVALGAHVVIVGRDQAALHKVDEVYPGSVTSIVADLTIHSDVDQVIAEISKNHSSLSILVNNAAIQTEMNLLEQPDAGWVNEARKEVALNFDAVVSLTIGLLPLLQNQPNAAIVNISSGLAIAPKKNAPVYCATKAALHSFSKALRYQCKDEAPHVQITEAIIALVDTDMTQGSDSGKITPHQAASEIIEGIVKGRNEVWVAKAKALRIINRLSPKLVERILR